MIERYAPQRYTCLPLWGVWDNVTGWYVIGVSYPTWSQALTAAGRLNRAIAKRL